MSLKWTIQFVVDVQFSQITQFRRCIFSKNIYIFRHLKLEIALAIPASNDKKYNWNNSAEQGLRQVAAHRGFICIGNVILENCQMLPIGGWLLMRVAAHSRFYCTLKPVSTYTRSVKIQRTQIPFHPSPINPHLHTGSDYDCLLYTDISVKSYEAVYCFSNARFVWINTCQH